MRFPRSRMAVVALLVLASCSEGTAPRKSPPLVVSLAGSRSITTQLSNNQYVCQNVTLGVTVSGGGKGAWLEWTSGLIAGVNLAGVAQVGSISWNPLELMRYFGQTQNRVNSPGGLTGSENFSALYPSYRLDFTLRYSGHLSDGTVQPDSATWQVFCRS